MMLWQATYLIFPINIQLMKYINYILLMETNKNSIYELISMQLHQPNFYTLNNISNTISQDQSRSVDQNANGKIHHDWMITNKSKIFNFTLLLASVCILYAMYAFIQTIEFINKNNIDNNSRLLIKRNPGQAPSSPITVKSINDVPRWATFYQEQSSDLRDIQRSRETLPSILQNQKGQVNIDVHAVIFSNSPPLNFQVVAGITGQKLKFGQKLLQLNFGQNQYQDIIFNFEKKYYEERYEISKYSQLPMCIIVPTYNNAQDQRYNTNFESILKQEYQNYRVIIIDDNSSDSTPTLIKKLIQEKKLNTTKYKLIENKVQMKALSNIRSAAQSYCDPKDIMIIVDGDDQLIGRQVFKLFNAVFQKDHVWFAYSNFVDISTKNAGYSRPIPPQTIINNVFRSDRFYTSHLRAFYTSLFLKIKEQDLKDSAGSFYQAANDVAICIPILQMSQNRVKYIPQLTYGYNSNTGINNHFIRSFEQQTNSRKIRQKSQYKRLQNL